MILYIGGIENDILMSLLAKDLYLQISLQGKLSKFKLSIMCFCRLNEADPFSFTKEIDLRKPNNRLHFEIAEPSFLSLFKKDGQIDYVSEFISQ